jgi:hypothetical protein
MKEQIESAIQWLKEQPIRGCITGSSLLEYFEGQDIDIFCYDHKSFTKLLFAMYHNPLFTILDPLEKWKFEQEIDKSNSSFEKLGLTTIKFTYNTCVPVNIVLKRSCTNVFSVLSSFDMDIIAKGYDIQTKQTMDLSSGNGKVASWNKWNSAYYSSEIWQINRILRQLERCFKYYKRGYDVDAVVTKYIELIDTLQNTTNIFASEGFAERLKITQSNTAIVKQICEIWLQTHEITDEQIELMKQKIKEI